jgi:phosphoribosyl 1,2-cyclic phosphodiesterase
MGLKFCSLASGSSGNCQFIGNGSSRLLIDAGLTGKYITNALNQIEEDPSSINGILVTHEHSDHIKGVGVIMRKYNIPLYVHHKTWEAMKNKIGSVKDKEINLFESESPFSVGDIEVKPFRVSHDAAHPLGYCVSNGKSKIGFATDLGYMSEDILKEIRDCELVLLESNHDEEMVKFGKYPWFLKKRILGEHGHISNTVAGDTASWLIKNGKLNNLLLGHLSKENNFPELAYETVKNILDNNSISIGSDIELEMTYRDKISKVYTL